MKFFTKEVRIALVTIAGIVLLFFGLNFLKGRALFSNRNIYFARFSNISGLSASSPIYADGYQVGTVRSIKYNYERSGIVLVQFEVDNDLRIPKGSSAEIESDLMGNVKMNLLLANNPRERVEVGDTIQGDINGGMLGTVGQLMPVVEKMLPKLDSILASVNTLLADPAIRQTLYNAQTASANLALTTRELNMLMAGLNHRVPRMMNKADYALQEAGRTLHNTTTLTGNLATIDIAGTMAKVDKTLTNVQQVTDRLNSNNGSLGLLMNDPSLYNNMNSTMRSADELLNDMKSHPKRYVHFSIFGRKDK